MLFASKHFEALKKEGALQAHGRQVCRDMRSIPSAGAPNRKKSGNHLVLRLIILILTVCLCLGCCCGIKNEVWRTLPDIRCLMNSARLGSRWVIGGWAAL